MEMVPPGSYRPAYSSNNNDGDDNITSLVCNTFRTNEVLGGSVLNCTFVVHDKLVTKEMKKCTIT